MNAYSDTRQRAISIRQPWAWAVIHGGKDVENRSETAARAYRPAVGQRVFIHASASRLSADRLRQALEYLAAWACRRRCPTISCTAA